ncbi:hypothetical protein As57867_006727, partial [Aphanomyces stellatus]
MGAHLASLDLVRAHQRGLCTPEPRTANEAMDFDSGDQFISIVSHRPCRRSPSVQAPNHQRGVAVCPVDDPSRSRADLVDDSVIQVGKDQDTSIDRPAPHTHQVHRQTCPPYPPGSPVQAPIDELLQQSPLELQLVTGNRSSPATKRALSPSPRAGTPLFTSNRFSLLQEDDVELSLDDYIVPRLVLEDASHPRVQVPRKKKPRNEAKKAHRDRAKK